MPKKGYYSEIKQALTLREIYRDYKKTELYKTDPCTQEEFVSSAREAFKSINTKMMTSGEAFRIPNLGILKVKKIKSKKPQVDWTLTRKYNKIIRYDNLHSAGYAAAIKWDRLQGKNRLYYVFESTRRIDRELAQKIKYQGTINLYETVLPFDQSKLFE